MTELNNAKQFPKIFYCRHMVQGIVGYENEKILVDTDAMKRAASSMVGKPVYVFHQSVDLSNIQEDADGWITECFYNELDGWLWAKFLAVSDDAQQAVERKWSVSNAYVPMAWSEEGQHLNVDYDRKIRDYQFTHLAIVPNPRYEDAKIFTPDEFKAYQASKRAELDELQNSKPIQEPSAMSFFRIKKEEIKAGDTILDTDITEIKNEDGSTETITVAELKKAKQAEKAAKAEAEKLNAKKNEKMVGDDEEVEVDGEMVNMGSLKTCYTNMKKNEKKNEDEAAKKEKEEKENADKEEKEKEKENAKLKELLNAHTKNKPGITNEPAHETMSTKMKRGSERY